MKKIVSLIIAMVLFIPVLTVYGSEEDRVMKIVSCPEQDFSTVCRPEYSFDFTPDGGFSLQSGDSEDADVITIFKVDAPGADFDAEYYFDHAYLELLESSYGSDLKDPGEYTLYPFGGRELPGRMAMYSKNGEPRMRFCLYDLQEDYFVRYEAFCDFDAEVMQTVIDDLSDLVRYFQPDAQYYSSNVAVEENEPVAEPIEKPIEEPAGEPIEEPAEKPIGEPIEELIEKPVRDQLRVRDKEPMIESDKDPVIVSDKEQSKDQVIAPDKDQDHGLNQDMDQDQKEDIEIIYPEMPEEAEAGPGYKTIICNAEGFTTRCGFYDEVTYNASTGVTAYLPTNDDSYLWVRVHRLSNDPDLDAEAYFRDEVTPGMEEFYADHNYSAEAFTSFTVDGKDMWGQEYHSSILGFDYTRRVMLYQTAEDLVCFEAQYTEDTCDKVMFNLEKIVRFYQTDPGAE